MPPLRLDHTASHGQPVFGRDRLRRSAVAPVQGGFHQRFVFAQSTPHRREFDHDIVARDTQHRATQEHRHGIRLSGHEALVTPLHPAADHLRWFLEHPAETWAMGKRGRQCILQDWNYENKLNRFSLRCKGS
jgi:hypothetical protein